MITFTASVWLLMSASQITVLPADAPCEDIAEQKTFTLDGMETYTCIFIEIEEH